VGERASALYKLAYLTLAVSLALAELAFLLGGVRGAALFMLSIATFVMSLYFSVEAAVEEYSQSRRQSESTSFK
jgi:uncharacterized membrane protein required for colicin V production